MKHNEGWREHLASRAALGLVLCVGFCSPAVAEKGDRDKPINIEADKVTLDDKQKVSVFDGNVVLTQGTLRITANKVTVREDKSGNQTASALGKPATFRQKRDAIDEYVEGFAERMEYDSKSEKVELFTNAVLKRNQDEVRGNYISYDAPTEFYQVLGGNTQTAGASNGSQQQGRVRVVIQPKPKGGAASQSNSGAPVNSSEARGSQ
jgi:lipopolysaccharide export system protein LptA